MNIEYLQTIAVASGNKGLEDLLTSYSDIVLSKTLETYRILYPHFTKQGRNITLKLEPDFVELILITLL